MLDPSSAAHDDAVESTVAAEIRVKAWQQLLDAIWNADGLMMGHVLKLAVTVGPVQDIDPVSIRWKPRAADVEHLFASIIERCPMKDTHKAGGALRGHEPYHALTLQPRRALELIALRGSIELRTESGMNHATTDQDACILAGRNGYGNNTLTTGNC